MSEPNKPTRTHSRSKAGGRRLARNAKAPRRDAPPVPDLAITSDDVWLFDAGTHTKAWAKLGAHPTNANGEEGTRFAVWAPHARSVSVIGDFNGWNRSSHPMQPVDDSGFWEAFVPGVGPGTIYKYHLVSARGGVHFEKADPFGFLQEDPPRTASIVTRLDHEWADGPWMEERAERQSLQSPMSIYEVHLGSWRRGPDGRYLGYREVASALADYVTDMGFTHVEILPIMEHPYYGSWGYQTTGYFAPTRRYGDPEDFAAFVDHLHERGIGVILDWVPSHFPSDGHALAYFDGTYLYEHEDPRRGYHPDWRSYIFDYERGGVRSFLGSSASFWIDRYHADALRVDAVASMLYLDYSRKEGEWIPNQYGGRENLHAIEFLRHLNQGLYRDHPSIQMIAEESTAWPMVSKPVWLGGLGFGMKWDMGWMHDTLEYMQLDPIHRAYHHGKLTFRIMYAWSENFVLPLSHDEVVHGKGSLINKMPGDPWQKFANLRLLFAFMWSQPGKKLLFMGGEIAQFAEWNHDRELDWWLLEDESHAGMQRLVRDLNHLYREWPALHRLDCDHRGFEWIEPDDARHSVLSFIRRGNDEDKPVVAVLNFTPVPRSDFVVGVPEGGDWIEILNTDSTVYGGSGVGNLGRVEALDEMAHGRPHALSLALPPLGAVFLVPERKPSKKRRKPTKRKAEKKKAPARKPPRKAPARKKKT